MARGDSPASRGALLHGLKLVAVAVIAQAVLGMARSFCPDAPRAAIAAAALALVAFVPGSLAQLAAIVRRRCRRAWLPCARRARRRRPTISPPRLRAAPALVALALFLALLALSFLPAGAGLAALVRRLLSLRRAGVRRRPCRVAAVARRAWLRRVGSQGAFLAGYGAAQAVPGPLFTFAAYLGAVAERRRPGSRAAASRWSRSSCRGCWRWSPRCRSGARCGARRDAQAAMAGSQRGGGRPARRGALQSGLCQRGVGRARFRRRGGGVRAARRRTRAAAPRRRPCRGGGRGARRMKRRITPPSSIP